MFFVNGWTGSLSLHVHHVHSDKALLCDGKMRTVCVCVCVCVCVVVLLCCCFLVVCSLLHLYLILYGMVSSSKGRAGICVMMCHACESE